MTIDNTQNAAASTPVDSTPDAGEARRIAVTRELIGGQLDAPTRAARLEELRRLTSAPDAVAAENKARTEAAGKVPASEKRRIEITQKLIKGNPTPQERAALTKELQQIIASQSTDAERDAMVNQPVEVLRERFGLDTKNESVLPPIREKWDSEGEAEVLATFADHGVAPEAVREIFDWYTRAFNGALGEARNIEDVPALETDFRAIAKKHGLGTKLVNALVQWQRGRLPS